MAVDLDGPSAERQHNRPEDLAIAERFCAAQAINAGTTTFIDNSHLVTLRMFDVMPSIERWTFAAEHGFDMCAEMGSWVPTWSNSARTGLMRPGHTYTHCSGFGDEM